MSDNLLKPIFLLTALIGSMVVARLFLQHGAGPFGVGLMALAIAVLAFRLEHEYALVMLGLVLAMGSFFRWDIVHSTYYLRFFLLGLLAIRAMMFVAITQDKLENWTAWTWLHGLFLTTGFVAVMTSVYSLNASLSFQRGVSLLLLYCVVFHWWWNYAKRPEQVKVLLRGLMTVFVVMIVVGFFLLLVGFPGLRMAGRLRLLFMNPNTLGHFCALISPILVWSLFEVPVRNILKVFVSVLLLAALIWSGSRGAMLSTLVGVGTLSALCYRKRLLLLAVVVGMVVGLYWLKDDPMQYYSQESSAFADIVVRQENLGSGSGRTDIWRAAWLRIDDKPWLGYGFGTTQTMFETGYFPWLADFQGGTVHNSYLETLLNMGWLGGSVVFVTLLMLLLLAIAHLAAPKQRTDNYKLTVALFATCLVGMVSAMFESWLLSVGSVFCMPFWLIAMLMMRMLRDHEDWQTISPIPLNIADRS